MIVSKRKPRTEALDYPATFDALYQQRLCDGASERDATLDAIGRCSALWLQSNPLHPDHLPADPKSCCWCGEKGATEPVPVLGSSVLAHHLCKPDLFASLAALARAGLVGEGLSIEVPARTAA
jgi:hypothetical protein